MEKITRRDWFRLRTNRPNHSLSESPDSQSNHLQPVELPVNHGNEDLSQLPPMREAILSDEQVSTLFRDIEQLATDIQLMQRSPQANRATGAEVNSAAQLSVARESLLSGQVNKLQIRYRWKESLWIDTLNKQPQGYRLIRIAHASL